MRTSLSQIEHFSILFHYIANLYRLMAQIRTALVSNRHTRALDVNYQYILVKHIKVYTRSARPNKT